MRRWLVVVAAVAVLVAAAAARPAHDVAGRRATACPTTRLPPSTRAGEIVLYGHVRSVRRAGPVYRVRFDPALWLGGETANRAAVEDKVIPPGEVVPNDYYVREEGHRLLTFRMPASAASTAITRAPGTGGFCATTIRAPELAQIVAGRNPRGRRLYVPGNRLGFWLRARIDTIRSLDQQYQP